MSNFVIPKGLPFDFTVKVIEQDSFLPQNLTLMDTVTSPSTFTIVSHLAPDAPVISTSLAVVDAINGVVSGSFTSSATTGTGALSYGRGDAVDGYYLKPGYFGVIVINFTDSTPSITTVINEILVTPTGN